MKKSDNKVLSALKAAFPKTVPIMTGFLFLGTAYGIYACTSGLPPFVPIIMAAAVFAGSMEFVAVDMLVGAFDPLNIFIMALMVNARHLFYGISMLDKYKNVGKKRFYLIFGMCDESFSINCTAEIPDNIDKGWYYFFVTLLNQIYWVSGTALGALAGSFITIQLKGLDFVMTALMVVIFLDNWLKEKKHTGSAVGLAVSIICLLIFGKDNFIIASMALIIGILTLLRPRIEREESRK